MKKIIYTDKAPSPIGPYSQAIITDNFLFISEQIPLTPEGIIAGDTIEVQTRQVLENIKQILEAVGLSFDNVMKTSVFMTDLNDFAKMNEVYNEYFEKSKPARTVIQVCRIPKDVMIGIETIAQV